MIDSTSGLEHIEIFLSKIKDTSKLSCINENNKSKFNKILEGETVISSLEKILDNQEKANYQFYRLIKEGSISIIGKLNKTPITYHILLSPDRDFLQAITVDISDEKGKRENFLVYTVKALTRASFENHEETGAHLFRLNHYSGKLAELIGLDQEVINGFYLMAELHDVGKIHFGRSLLNKPGKLTEEEYEEIKKHTIYGARIIGDEPKLKLGHDLALMHHEKWDGTGYPFGLREKNIPITSRIVTILDVFDALVSQRAYKQESSYNETKKIMTEGDKRINPSKYFDPELLKIFTENYELFVDIHRNLSDNSNSTLTKQHAFVSHQQSCSHKAPHY